MVQPCAAIFGGTPVNLPIQEIPAYPMPRMRLAKKLYCIVARRFPVQFYFISGNGTHPVVYRIFIIALELPNKDLRMYNASPEVYSPASYNNLKAGRICAIIGLILQGLIIIFYAILFVFALSTGMNNWR